MFGDLVQVFQFCAAGVSASALTRALEKVSRGVTKLDARPGGDDQIVGIPDARKDRDKFVFKIKELMDKGGEVFLLPHNHDEAEIVAEFFPKNCALPPLATLKTVNDKYLFYTVLRQMGYDTPEFWPVETHCRSSVKSYRDIIVKPRRGCGSEYTFRTRPSPQELFEVEEILDFDEFTADLVAWDGKLVDLCVRQRMKTHGGICIDAVIVHREEFKSTVSKFVKDFSWRGPCALQFIRREKQKLLITDCNPRFGGGVGLSLAAGWQGVYNLFHFVSSNVLSPKILWAGKVGARVSRVFGPCNLGGNDE